MKKNRKLLAVLLIIALFTQPLFSAIDLGQKANLIWDDQVFISRMKEKLNSDLGFNEDEYIINQTLLDYIEDEIYFNLVSNLDSEEFFVEKIEAVYISQEYLEEVKFNSRANVYFGYPLEEILSQFSGTGFIFTYDNKTNKTEVKEFLKYDDSYDRALRNVAIGAGVIMVCATVSIVTGGVGLPAVSMIFAASAKSATIMALSSGAISSIAAGIFTGVKTRDFDEAVKTAAVVGSESFKWGAIVGAISGGIGKAINLKGATLNGLTMNEAATIQKESKYPVDVIKQFASKEQYEICKQANLFPRVVNGKTALVRNIDINYLDEFGRTNLQRMISGLAPLDPSTGKAYQLHHIGQKMDSTLAILTEAEHMQGGNNTIWHIVTQPSTIDRTIFAAQRNRFWNSVANLISRGEL